MDPPAQLLTIIRTVLGCNGSRNFFDFSLMKLERLHSRITLASKKLTRLNIVSLCVVWLVEQTTRVETKEKRTPLVKESCLRIRRDVLGNSTPFTKLALAIEDEIVIHFETVHDEYRQDLFKRDQKPVNSSQSLTSCQAWPQDPPRLRGTGGSHYSPPRRRRSNSPERRRPPSPRRRRRDCRSRSRERSPRDSTSKNSGEIDKYRPKDSPALSDSSVHGERQRLIHTLPDLLNQVYAKGLNSPLPKAQPLDDMAMSLGLQNGIAKATHCPWGRGLIPKVKESKKGVSEAVNLTSAHGIDDLSPATPKHEETHACKDSIAERDVAPKEENHSTLSYYECANDPFLTQPPFGVADDQPESCNNTSVDQDSARPSPPTSVSTQTDESSADRFLEELRFQRSATENERMFDFGSPGVRSNEDLRGQEGIPEVKPRHPLIERVMQLCGGFLNRKPTRRTALEMWEETDGTSKATDST